MNQLPATSYQLPATSYQLPALGKGWAASAMLMLASLHGLAREGNAQQFTPKQTRYSTHDWTAPVGGGEPVDFRESWADVKTPGDGYAYSVGTIEVQTTAPGSQFSGEPAADSTANFVNLTNSSLVRQVVLLQKTRTIDMPPFAAQSIAVQRYFHGDTLTIPNTQNQRATNARGISVWPAATPEDTRVVICGEVYDRSVPLSQDPNGFPAANGSNATGFLAVYDGNLTLLWTHHFFGTSAEGQCAVTDISVRVVDGGSRDVVTYCGISTFGSPVGGNASLTSVLPFSAATPPCGSGARAWAGGDTDNGVGQSCWTTSLRHRACTSTTEFG